MLLAVDYLHKRNMCHLDIKMENILVQQTHSEVQVKLIDFGLTLKFDPGKGLKRVMGTPIYMAPEMLRNTEPYN